MLCQGRLPEKMTIGYKIEAISISTGVVTLLVIGGTFVILGALFSHKHDPQEPPYISPTIPYIGHLIGLLMKRYDYYVNLR